MGRAESRKDGFRVPHLAGWTVPGAAALHDEVLRAIAAEIRGQHVSLHDWLLSVLPGREDEEHLGFGPWLRASDQEVIERYLDVRELHPESQRVFVEAVRCAGARAENDLAAYPEPLRGCLLDLADMAARMDRGEPPLTRSEWREVHQAKGRKIGPGWEQ